MEKRSRIFLNKETYPLYVGGGAADGFLNWEKKGSSVLLEAFVDAEGYGASDVQWRVENAEIADFDRTQEECCGKRRIRAVRTGITKVRASLPDGAGAECVLTVIDHYSRLTIVEIELNTDELELCAGKRARLIPILYPKDLYGNGMLNERLLWKSMDESVAVVEDGLITAAGEGETVIEAVSVDVGRRARCHVKVTGGCGAAGQAAAAGQADGTAQAAASEQADGTARAAAAGPEELVLTEGEKRRMPGKAGIVWRSENRYVVSVDADGLASADSVSRIQRTDESGLKVMELPAQVFLYATEIKGGAVTRYPVRVEPAGAPLHQISVFPATCDICAGERKRISAAVNYAAYVDAEVRWESSDPKIISVEPAPCAADKTFQAYVTARAAGETYVTASVKDKKASCRIRAVKAPVRVDFVRMEQEREIDVDQVYQFRPAVTERASNKRLHWIGTDFSVATLDREGNVQGYRPGECRIYAVADDSLTPAGRQRLEALQAREDRSASDEEIRQLLADAVYGVCRLKVRAGSPCLRNVHAVREAVTAESVLLLWNRAALPDAGAFERYRVTCDGRKMGTTKKLGYRAEGLKPDTEYDFLVEALDREGRTLEAAELPVRTAKASHIVNVLDYGAAGDGKHMDTLPIQRAIDACPAGGTVLLSAGHVFVSGALFLKSDMTLRVDGVLLGSADPKDYPRVVTKWEGWRKLEQPAQSWANSTPKVPDNHCPHASLLNAGCYAEGENGCSGPYNVENLVICGRGQINANGFALAYNEGPNQNAKKLVSRDYPVKDATLRGSAVRMHNCRSVYVKDVQIAYAPGWTVHTIYCDHITFEGMEVVSQGDGDCGFGTDVLHCGHILNGDGIDPESCTHVNLFDILFTTGDDAVAMKSGRNQEGNVLDKPNAYIRITDCVSRWSLGGFGTGSETAAGSHDILMQNLEIEHILVSGIWIKTNADRGGITEYIQVRDVRASDCSSPVWVLNAYTSTSVVANPSKRLASVRHLSFENVHGSSDNERGFRLTGTPEIPIRDVSFRHISDGGKENRMKYCENVTGLSQTGGDGRR